jgi:radical SAM superfamily enzyme YgiQ (UPF0313 family)
MAQSDILLLACYELGHQPLSLAWPAAALRQAGHDLTAVDLAVEPLPREAAVKAHFVGISVPMHTALRLGTKVAAQIRELNPTAHICFFGLYAWLNADYLLNGIGDSVIAGEVEVPLVDLVDYLLVDDLDESGKRKIAIPGVSTATHRSRPHLARLTLPEPDRTGLPDLSVYAHYQANGYSHRAGYVEASRGCLHTCRHCPVVPVYGGRFFVVAQETVMADIRNQVAAGADHITFGDPDFLNGPGHVMKIARALHAEFPRVTFDFTTKVEHILQHQELFLELRSLGAGFVVSAFEHVSDDILVRLNKGHSRTDMDKALTILRQAELPVQPTWLPFTPWTTLENYIELVDWISERDLIQNVPAVQLSIRLLVPPNSDLLNTSDSVNWRGQLNPAQFSYEWRSQDPCVDELQQHVALLVEQARSDPYETFTEIERLAYGMAGRRPPARPALRLIKPAPPRLTEDWFC